MAGGVFRSLALVRVDAEPASLEAFTEAFARLLVVTAFEAALSGFAGADFTDLVDVRPVAALDLVAVGFFFGLAALGGIGQHIG